MEFVQALAERLEISKSDADAFAKVFFETVEENLLKDKLVKIKGLGTFKLVGVSDRESVDVNTGERIRIAGHDKVSFTPDNTLKDMVNRPFAEFQTTILNEGTSQEQMESLEPLSVVKETESVAEETLQENVESQPQDDTEVVTDSNPVEVEEEVHDEVLPEAESEEQESKQEERVTEEERREEVVIPETAKTKDKSNMPLYEIAAVVAFLIVLSVCAYFSGFFEDFSNDKQTTENVVAQKVDKPKKAAVKDTPAPKEEEVIKPEPTPEELAKDFPQVENGEYWIVGEIGTDTMKVGTNLYRISQKQLGNKNLMNYIVVFNNIKNPDVIPPGFVFHIPRLVKK